VSYSQLGVWLKDPVRFVKFFWPDVVLYSREREIMYSVRDNDETVVVAGNMLGKDFTAALVVLWFFLTRHPVRVVTTSADYSQLQAVLWGEMRRFIQTSAHPLSYERGGPVVDTHLHLRKVYGGEVCGLSYVIGRVAAKGEGMLGHHVADVGDGVPRTLFVADEASGVDDTSFQRSSTWAKRSLVIGNPFPCANHFYRAVKAGDIVAA
jgi:phage terminase large subunit